MSLGFLKIGFRLLFRDKEKIAHPPLQCNPFDVWTGPALFNWRRDVDRLLYGPFEVRVLRVRVSFSPDKKNDSS